MSDFLDTLRSWATPSPVPAGEKPDTRPIQPGELQTLYPTIFRDPAPVAPPAQVVSPVAPPEKSQDRVLTEAEILAQSLRQIQAGHDNPVDMARLTVSQERGNDLTANNVLFRDYDALTPIEFQQKYGQEIYNLMTSTAIAGQRVKDLESQPRNPLTHAYDAAVQIGNDAIQGVGGLTGLALQAAPLQGGKVGDFLAAKNAEIFGAINNGMSEMQSDELNNLRFVDAIRAELDQRDNARKKAEDIAKDGSLIAGFRDLGRQVISGAGRLGESPSMLETGVAGAVGSTIFGGALTKGAVKAGGALKAAQALEVAAATLFEKAMARAAAVEAEKKAVEKAIPLTIGAQEAGGAYNQTIQEVLSTPIEQLQDKPEYQRYVARGYTPDEARRAMAKDAGQIAELITAPAAVVAGKVGARFEAAPFSQPLGELPANVGGQVIEEGLQGAAGQLAQNVGIQQSGVDPNRDVLEQVGEQAAQGAIIGGLAPVATAAPGAAARLAVGTAVGGAKIAADTAAKGYDIVKASGEKTIAAREASSPVSAQTLAPQVQEAAQAAPAVGEGLRAMATETGAPAASVESYVNRVVDASRATPDDLAHLPVNILTKVAAQNQASQGGVTKFDVMQILADVASDQNAGEQDRIAAGTFLLKNIEDNKKLFTEDLPEFLQKVPQDRPEYQQFLQYARTLQASTQTPQIQDAAKWAETQMQMSDQDLSQTDLNSDVGKTILNNTLEAAKVAPQAVNPQVVDQIIQKADEGLVSLSPEQRAVLNGAVALNDAGQTHVGRVEGLDAAAQDVPASQKIGDEVLAAKTRQQVMDFVSQQIETDGGLQAHQLSLSQHAAAINQALARGPEGAAAARRAMQNLARFALSMRNKVNAVNTSIEGGKGEKVGYDTYGRNGRLIKDAGKVTVAVHVGNQNSERLARQIHSEALAVAKLSNDYAAQHPSMGIHQIKIPELKLNGAEVAKAAPQVVSKVREESSTAPKPAQSQATTSGTKTASQTQATTSGTEETPKKAEPSPTLSTESATAPIGDTKRTEPAAPASTAEAKQETGTQNSEPAPAEATGVTKPAAEKKTESAAVATDDITDETSNAPAAKLEDTFPKLVQPAGRNFFHKAFRAEKVASSRALNVTEPMRATYRMLGKHDGFAEFLGKKDALAYDLNTSDRDNLKDLLKLAGEALKVMNDRLATKLTSDGILAKIQDGNETMIRTRDLRALNLVDADGKYDPELIQAAMLAGLDWVLNAQDRKSRLDMKDVAGILGISDAYVLDDHIRAFNRGMSLDLAKRSLAEGITKFWGVKENRQTPLGLVKGIPEAIAAEILHGLHVTGLLEVGTEEFPEISKKTYNRVWFDTRPEQVNDLVRSLNGVGHFFSDLVLVDPEPVGASIGAPVTQVAETQLRNPNVKTTRQQRRVIERAQATPYKPNIMVHEFLQAIGLEDFVSFLSKSPYAAGDLGKTHAQVGLNVNHWKSLQGVQRGLVASYENVMKHMAQVAKHAEKAGVPVSEVPTFFKHNINRIGRLQMGGEYNPQSDKAIREVLMPTRSVLDLSDPWSPTFQKFLVGIGQGIGLKTEDLTRQVVGDEVLKSMLDESGKFYPLVQEMKSWLKDRAKKKGKVISRKLYDQLRVAFDGDLSMHGLHSLLAFAQYDLTREEGGDLKNFETHVYLEADGKTNGPINALMLFTAGKITDTWLQTIAKGGVFFGRLDKTLNSRTGDERVDLYNTGAQRTTEQFKVVQHNIEQSAPEVGQHYDVFKRVLQALDLSVSVDGDGNLQLSRKELKNPLTITVYGSGANGIAGKITNEVLSAMYEHISSTLHSDKTINEAVYPAGSTNDFHKDLSVLTSVVAVQNMKTQEYYLDGSRHDLPKMDGKFTLTSEQFAALRSNTLTYLVVPMANAINSVIGQHVSETTELVQGATQLQSIILRGLFQKEIARLLALKASDPEAHDYSPGDFLSQAELDGIIKKLQRFAPVINTGTQSYMLSGSEKSDLFNVQDANGKTVAMEYRLANGKVFKATMPESFSRSLTGDMRSPAYVNGPTLAKVSAIPTLTIGSGDGQMQLNFLDDHPEAAKRVLHVFDGTNIPVDAIEEYSRYINGSVFKTWTENKHPVRAVQESFAQFMAQNPIEELFTVGDAPVQQQEYLTDIQRVIEGKRKVKGFASPEEAKAYFEMFNEKLAAAADEFEIRQQVYQEFGLSVDQMAGAESPYVNQGTQALPDGASYVQIAQAMDARRQDLAGIAAAKRRKGEPAQARAFQDGLAKLAAGEPNGVQVLSTGSSQMEELRKIISTDGNSTQKVLADAAIDLLKSSGYRIVFGAPSELDAWEQANNADRFVPGTNYGFGKIDPVSKIIIISNIAPETLVHELIHAATIDKVRAFYDQENRAKLSSQDQEALSRIEGLMGDWLDDAENDTLTEDYGARDTAMSAIYDHLTNGNKAEALNEFMAWVLSNQQLAEIASKTKVKNPLFRIIGDALKALKVLIWGAENKGPRVGDDVLSNLRFNTQVLMATATPAELLSQDSFAVSMYQSPIFGSDDRLTVIRETLDKKILSWLDEPHETPLAQHARTAERERDAAQALQDAEDVTNVFAYHFPDLGNMQAKSTFAAILQTMATDIQMNPNSLARIEEIYAHVIKTLQAADFRENQDPNDQNDATWAQDKYNALQGVYINKTDRHGRSSLMSSFLALAMTSDQFRKILANMDLPKGEKDKSKTVDAMLENLGNAGIDRVSQLLSGQRRADRNVQQALDSLMVSAMNNVGDQRSFIAQRIENGVDGFENYLSNVVQNVSDKVMKKTSAVIQSPKTGTVAKATKIGAGLVNFAATVINEEGSKAAARGVVAWLDRRDGLNTVRAFVNDLLGPIKDNLGVTRMISEVRASVQKTRQEFRNDLPKVLAKQFSRALSRAEWSSLYQVLGKTDIASLVQQYGTQGALEMASDPKKRAAEVKALEAKVQSLDARKAQAMLTKAKQLATYMVTGEHGAELLRNAEAVARLLHERGSRIANAPSAELVTTLDQLITLYALNQVSQEYLDVTAALVNGEKDGMSFVTDYLVGQRLFEMEKSKASTVALFNHYKGDIPAENLQGGTLIIASNKEHARLLTRGYTKVADYGGSTADRALGRRSYYFSAVSGRAPFTQGVLQTVHQTASGVDPQTGFTVGKVMAGKITDPSLVALTQKLVKNQAATKENLLPVFDDKGDVVAYERAADPAKLARLKQNTHLGEMIGVWRGRQAEELLAQEVNKRLIDNLHEAWIKGKSEGREKEFVNISALGRKAGDDPILLEATKLIPNMSKAYIKEVFGDEFMVRRSLLLDTFGARQASVGDLFDGGNTRWNPKVAREFEKVVSGLPFIGKNAYSHLVGAEQFVQEFVANAKTTIVVRSVVVPAANMTANMFQLLARGVPFSHIIRGVPAKAIELNAYIKRRHREVELEAELRAAQGRNSLSDIRKIENQLQSIKDINKSMSIWPLIEAGEFSSVTDSDVSAEDLAMADGKWSTYLRSKLDKLPPKLRTGVRYALVSHDTALFQALAKSVQYGDFIGKAILYDDLTRRKRVKSIDAIDEVSEAFVNYNRLAGRSRQYLESVGLLWFYNYKLRIMREAAYSMRRNPLRTLLMMSMPNLPLVGDIGLPVTDNILSLGADGKLGWSFGPNMGLHNLSLNPWVNLLH